MTYRICIALAAGVVTASAHAAPLGLDSDSGLLASQRISPTLVTQRPAPPEHVGGALRVATAVAMDVTSANHGVWETTGQRDVWRTVVHADGARSLGVSLRVDDAVPGQTLHAYAPDGSHIADLTHRRVIDGVTHSPLISGDAVVVELSIPAAATRPLVTVTRADYGHTDPARGQAAQKSGACNVDVVCPQADPWRDEIRSVARYTFTTVLGTSLCTGTLVNNTSGDGRPLFLTANHCVSTQSEAASMDVFWNYETSTCGGTPDGSLNQSQAGAQLLATSTDTDFTLVELDAMPDARFDVHYAGWDATGATPSAATAIHHPQGDEKRISFEYDALTATSYSDNTPRADGTHWRVADWDLGTTEGGSSGSAIWNDAMRIVGQLEGGAAACGNDDPDWYGRLSVSWDNGAMANSLRPHLDPGRTGTLALSGMNPAGGGGGSGGGTGGGTPGGSGSGGGSGPLGSLTLGWLGLLALAATARRRRR